jgi:pimeloyl-ACP methyl ester carboxylesterase
MVAAVASAPRISESRVEVDGVGVHVRRTDGEGPPAVFVHGNPTDSGDWVPFMERLRRPAIAVDLPGWGRSDQPEPGRFDYSMGGQARFFGRILETLGVDRHALFVHDWGVIALLHAIGRPESLERLVICNAVPLLPGYRWHYLARLWRTPGLGALLNRSVTRPALRLASRFGPGAAPPLPDWMIERIHASWNAASSRAILDLYRSADPPVLAAAGHGLGALSCPTLVAWGLRDPYLPPRFGRLYAERIPGATLLELPDAGHWPWVERADLVTTLTEFLRIRGFAAG